MNLPYFEGLIREVYVLKVTKTSMSTWMQNTKERIELLRRNGYFENWRVKNTENINFYIFPKLDIPIDWFEKRENIYKKNATLFEIKSPPKIEFYVYPSPDSVKDLGIVPAVSFLKKREIHGHLKQSAGHELTHILLGEINPSENFPPNGLWAEGICTYYDGTETDRRKHTTTLNYSKDILSTGWSSWNENLPGDLYPLAGSIVQYCANTYELKEVLRFVKGMRDGGTNVESLCLEIFHVSYQKLQSDWEEWLKKAAS